MTTDLTPTITDDEVSALPLADARADLLRELLTDTGAASEPPRRTRRWIARVVAAAAVLADRDPRRARPARRRRRLTPSTPRSPRFRQVA